MVSHRAIIYYFRNDIESDVWDFVDILILAHFRGHSRSYTFLVNGYKENITIYNHHIESHVLAFDWHIYINGKGRSHTNTLLTVTDRANISWSY